MKRAAAALVTLLLVVSAVWLGPRGASRAIESDLSTPEACLQQVFSAAERGDIEGYVNCFTGAEREAIRRELAAQPRDRFARSLIAAATTLKGRAVFPTQTDASTAGQAAYTVERVYANRMERQLFRLLREPDGWRIWAVEALQAYQPHETYGTPVFPIPSK